MSGKLKEVLVRLAEAKQLIKTQQAEIDHLKKLLDILRKHP